MMRGMLLHLSTSLEKYLIETGAALKAPIVLMP